MTAYVRDEDLTDAEKAVMVAGAPAMPKTVNELVGMSQRFYLYRHQDLSGISGTGIVADGIKWPDGTVTIRWRGNRPSTVNWNSIEDAESVHGHGGATVFVWIGSDLQGESVGREGKT